MNFGAFLICVLAFTSCTKKKNPSYTPSPTPQPPSTFTLQSHPNTHYNQNLPQVLIIDSGFDASHDVFKDKIVTTHTLVCREPVESDESSATTYEEYKKQAIQAFSRKDESCSLTTGIELNISPRFKDILSQRETWNNAVQRKTIGNLYSKSQIETFGTILTGSGTSYNYHGTATAGLIAYQNSAVQLHLLQIKLGKSGGGAGVGTSTSECPTQKEIDLLTRLYGDADVVRAYVNAPISLEDEQLSKLISDYKVDVVNMSFGASSRKTLEDTIAKVCPRIDLRGYYKARAQVNEKRFLAKKTPEANNPHTLFIQAAGNDGESISSGEDAFECVPKSQKNRVLIGSYSKNQALSEFSNYGDCVELYSLGEMVVVAAPYNFLFIENGTSFSSPLVVRYVSKLFQRGKTATDYLADLRNQKNTHGYLSENTFPTELAYLNYTPVHQYALVPLKPVLSQKMTDEQVEWARYAFVKDLSYIRKSKK